MYTTKITIRKITEVETIAKADKTLTVRWIEGDSNGIVMAFKVWNDLTSHPKVIDNNVIDVDFKIVSRESNNRYYTDLTITKIY